MRPEVPEIDAPGIPQMDVQVRGSYCRVQAPEDPGVTRNQFGQGKAIYCALPLFEAYHQEGTPVLRKLAAWMLHLVHPPAARSIVLDNAPLTVEVS